jgi:prepilin-type N-terminal cleavage/methylation domain-containing protein
MNKKLQLEIRVRPSYIQKIVRSVGGFSLIELLVVMAIISVLSGISLLALRGARESGRDARRKADLEHISSGIEIYKADCNSYPTTLTAGSSLVGNGAGSCSASNTYIQSVPDDPDSTRDYDYDPLPGGCTTCPQYILWTSLETEPTPTLPPYCTGSSNCGTPGCNFCVRNP